MAKQQAKSVLSMADPNTLSQNLAIARTNISRLLAGETPRLIDEWQIAPQFWDAVRNEVDNRDDDGQFMLTGSAVPGKGRKVARLEAQKVLRLLKMDFLLMVCLKIQFC